MSRKVLPVAEAIEAAVKDGDAGEGCLVGVDLGHIKANYPFAYWACFKLKMTSAATFDKHKAMWKVKSMNFPEWLAPFHADSIGCCLRLNHVRGLGCGKSPCNFKHVCIMCNGRDHGVFEKAELDGSSQYRCKLHLGLLQDLLEMRRQYKFGGRDEADSVSAFALDCGITTGLFGSIAIPLIVKMKRDIPTVVAVPSLKSLGINLTTLGSASSKSSGKNRVRSSSASDALHLAEHVEPPRPATTTALMQGFNPVDTAGSPQPESPCSPSPHEVRSVEATSGVLCGTAPTAQVAPAIILAPPSLELPSVAAGTTTFVLCVGCFKTHPLTENASTVLLPCNHRVCRECYAKRAVCKAAPDFNGETLLLQVISCPMCSEIHMINPDQADEPMLPPPAEALRTLTSFTLACSAHPVIELVQKATYILDHVPQPRDFGCCNELHLAEVYCKTCKKYYCAKCTASIHRILQIAEGGPTHSVIPVVKVYDQVHGMADALPGFRTAPKLCPEHGKPYAIVSVNDISRVLGPSPAFTSADSPKSLLLGVPEPLGCTDCLQHGRHATHTIQKISIAAELAEHTILSAVKSAVRDRRILDHILEVLSEWLGEQRGKPGERNILDQMQRIKEVRNRLENIGNCDGPMVLETAAHRLALIGVALEFKLV